jgi:predicted CxxxxCH...CXXCH cytochrome family protein
MSIQASSRLAAVLSTLVAVALAGCGGEVAGSAALGASSQALTQDEACLDTDPLCTPTGAHAKHGGFACSVCHKVAGRLSFDSGGPAYAAGKPAPAFNATTKTCSNVACHGVPAGTFSYYFPDGTGEPALNTVAYGGTTQPTPSWYAAGASCAACHGNPPRAPGGGVYAWHSGSHGAQGPTGARNQCQFCHPNATGSNGVGTGITNPALHANGAVNVQATFGSACFGCH